MRRPTPAETALGALAAPPVVATLVNWHRYRVGDVPPHGVASCDVTCPDDRYNMYRAWTSVSRWRPGLSRPRLSSVFPRVPVGGAAGLLDPVVGPAEMYQIRILHGVAKFTLLRLRAHVGGPKKCGFLNTRDPDQPLWLGKTHSYNVLPTWGDFDFEDPDSLLQLCELSREAVAADLPDLKLDIEAWVDRVVTGPSGFPKVQTIRRS